jgi:hypothetical protein
MLAQASREAEAALKIDGRNGDAYAVLANTGEPKDWTARERLFLRGLTVEPSSPDLNWRYSIFLAQVGRLQESAVVGGRAFALNPLNASRVTEAALSQAMLGRFKEAGEIADRMESLWPEVSDTWGVRFYLDLWQGDYASALAHLDVEPGNAMDRAGRDMWRRTFLALGSKDVALRRDARQMWVDNAGQGDFIRSLSVEVLTGLGDLDDAFAAADGLRMTPLNPDGGALFSPNTAPLRRDRRFMRTAAKLGLVDYWRSSGHWPDFCSQPALPYDCKAEAAKWAGPRGT